MAATIRLVRFGINPNDGYIEATFANSISGETGRRWATMEELQAEIAQLESTEDVLIRYLMGYWTARNADLSNPSIMLNKDLTIDFGAANPIRVQ